MSSDLATQYQRKTDNEHILDNPDTYIGSVENVDAALWVYDDESKMIKLKNIEYVPGLYKLFDEGIVNCRDHVVRMIHSPVLDKKMVSDISVKVEEDGTIIMENDGNGIDVAKHPEYGIWIPEMIFGHLRTSTNYNKAEKRIVGGKNGFGFKLVLIWSTYGKIETLDHRRGLMYTQEFKDNLDTICPPVIKKTKSLKPYTRITFKPDYARFGMPNGITSDMFSLLKKRTYDIAASTDQSAKKVKVHYNGEQVPVKNFQQYIDMYIGNKSGGVGNGARVYESSGERWEYAVALSPTHEFTAISFVNGICTFKGGKHVDYIIGQITRKLVAYIEKKKKINVNQNAIKEQLILFLRCDIENPAFDSQTKDFMNTPSSKFGSTCNVSDGFVEKVAKMGVMDVACSLMEAKQNKAVAKKTDGSKTKSIRGIQNLIDANYSGTNKSKDCVLILCEGLSALSGIVSGLSSEDRNTIGIYPLKGKLLNVRGEAITKVAENKEITDLKKILGLENEKEYLTMEDVHNNLRYSKIMILCDQDTDGSHIKGLCINLFHSEWASLIRIPGFLSFMNTPILRAKKGGQTKVFYNEGEYQAWKDELDNNTSGWTIKYFKGLGTSTSTEFKEYFANKKVVDFVYTGPESDDIIDKIFNKKRANDRKSWLENYDKDAFLDTSRKSVKYEEFIDNIITVSQKNPTGNFDLTAVLDLTKNLKDTMPNGRVGIDLLDEASTEALVIQDGDILTIPEKSNHIYIYGEVNYEGALKYINKEDVDYYINKSGGLKENASKESIYVLHPNGDTQRFSMGRKNVFQNSPSAKMQLYPGSVIFVPRGIDNSATNRLAAQAYVSILGNIGIALASLSSISNNN